MIKTVSLTAGIEMAVELMGGYHASIENRGNGVIYASKTSGIIADSDGVTAIDSGNSKVLRNIAQYKKSDDNSYDYYGKIYLLSDTDTKAEIQTANDLSFKYKNTAKGGGTYDDTAIKADISDLQKNKANASDLKNYVTKATGYGLSTNDFTTEEKNKLAGLENYDDSEIKAEIADSGWVNIDLMTATTNLILDNTVSNYLNYRKIGHIVYVKGSMKFTSISDEDVVMENMTGVLPDDFKPEKAAVLLGRCGTFVNNNNSDFQPIYWQFNPSGSVSVSMMNNQKLSGAINKSVSVQGSYIID